MNLGDTLRRNTLWVLTGDAGARLIGLGLGVILARLLMPEDFGLLVTVQILTGALGFLAAGGTGDALVRGATIEERDIRTVFALQVGTCTAIFVLLNLIAPLFAEWFKDGRLDPLLRVSAITFLLRPFMSVPHALLQRSSRFREISILIVLGMTVGGLASIGLALLGLGTWSLLLGGLIGALVRILVTARLARWTPALAFDRASARTLGLFGLKLSVNDIVRYANSQTANALVSRQLGVAQVGLFNKAESVAEVPNDLLAGSAYQTLFRALASVQDQRERCARLFLRSITVVCFYALPFYVGLVWVAEPFVVTLYGEQWAAAGLPLQILAATGLLRAVANLSRAVAAAHNRLGREIVIQLETWALLGLGILIGLNWGLAGVALGVLPSFAHNAIRLYGLAGRTLGTDAADLWRALAPVILLNGLLAGVLGSAHLLLEATGLETHRLAYLTIMIGLGALTYGGLFLLRPAPALRTEAQRWHRQIELLRRRLAQLGSSGSP